VRKQTAEKWEEVGQLEPAEAVRSVSQRCQYPSTPRKLGEDAGDQGHRLFPERSTTGHSCHIEKQSGMARNSHFFLKSAYKSKF
jgi:hypothetical protein